MNEAEAVAAIRAYFVGLWGSTSPIIHDDESKPIPESGGFVRLNVRHIFGAQTTMGAPGNNRHMLYGTVTVQICQPQGDASVTARAQMAQAAAIFRGKTVSNILFYDVHPREIGNDGRGYFTANVVASFRYDLFA